MGKLQPFSLGISEIDETYGIEKRTYQIITRLVFKLKEIEGPELPQLEGKLAGQSPNQCLKGVLFIVEFFFW